MSANSNSIRCASCPLSNSTIAGIGPEVPCWCLADPWPEGCRHAASGSAYWTREILARSGIELPRAIVAGPATPLPPVDPAARDRVNACPHRGGELPLSAQSGGCCGGGPTLFECTIGKGSMPGRVTTLECLACQTDSTGRS